MRNLRLDARHLGHGPVVPQIIDHHEARLTVIGVEGETVGRDVVRQVRRRLACCGNRHLKIGDPAFYQPGNRRRSDDDLFGVRVCIDENRREVSILWIEQKRVDGRAKTVLDAFQGYPQRDEQGHCH